MAGVAGTERTGAGLGLAISARLVALMKGSFGVRSAAGAGSTFWFEVPFAVDELVASSLHNGVAGTRVLEGARN